MAQSVSPTEEVLGLYLKSGCWGTSLVDQRLALGALTAEGLGLIPGWGTKILRAARCSQKKPKKTGP